MKPLLPQSAQVVQIPVNASAGPGQRAYASNACVLYATLQRFGSTSAARAILVLLALAGLLGRTEAATNGGPFVFKNETGSDVNALLVTFDPGDVDDGATPVTVTMEPVGTGGTSGARVDATHVLVTWPNKAVSKGSLVAFVVKGSAGMKFKSAQWKDGNTDVGGAINTLYANLGDDPPVLPKAADDKNPRIRKNIYELTATEQKTLVDAFLLLHDPKRSPPQLRPIGRGDPHDRFEEYILLHARDFGNAHGQSWFLPWHRKVLFDLETEMRALDPPNTAEKDKKFNKLTLPYWDWTKDDFPQHVKGAANNDLMGPDGNAGADFVVEAGRFGSQANEWRTYNANAPFLQDFYGKKHERSFLRRRMGDPALKAAEHEKRRSDLIAKEADFKKFTNQLERGPSLHGAAHNSVGRRPDLTPPPPPQLIKTPFGHMGVVPVAVNDPSFFLVHAHVDEIWAEWQCLNKADKYDPNAGSVEKKKDEKMGLLSAKAQEVFNFRDLGYTYEFPAGKRIEKDRDDLKCVIPQGIVFLDQPRKAGAMFVFSISTQPGYDYLVESKATLGGAWSPLLTVRASGFNTVVSNSISALGASSFFRVREETVAASNAVIYAFAHPGGTVSPAGAFQTNLGSALTFAATPGNGFAIRHWFLDGAIAQNGGTDFSFAVASNHTLSVSFDDLSAPLADIAVSATVSTSSVPMLAPFTYTLQVTNQGPNSATNVIVADYVPENTMFLGVGYSQGEVEIIQHEVDHAHIVYFYLGSLASGGNATMTITVAGHELGPAINYAMLISVDRDSDETNDAVTTVTDITF